MKYIFLILFALSSFSTFSQHEGNTWRLCYSGSNIPVNPESKVGFVETYFTKPPYPKLERNLTDYMYPYENRVSINNTVNEVIIFYDGQTLYNKVLKPMKGGDTLNFNQSINKVNDVYIRQGGIALPYPNQKNKYALLHTQTEYYNLTPTILNILVSRTSC